MPTYTYKALGPEQTQLTGTIAAPSRREALQQLIDRGQSPLDLRESAGRAAAQRREFHFGKRLFRLATLTRQLATLSVSGIPIVKGMNVLIEQHKEPRAKRVLTEILDSVKGGSTFADALEMHPRIFPPLMTNLIRVGEEGGTLDEELLQLSELYEKEEELQGEVKSALAYPVLVLVLGLVSTGLLVTFFVPQLKTMFDDFGQELPLPTRILLGISDLFTAHPVVLLIALCAAPVAIHFSLRSPRVSMQLDRIKLGVPWFGDLLRNVEIARFSRILGTLTHGGVSLVEALKIVQPVMRNKVISQTVGEIAIRIRTGERLADLMKERDIFPPLAIQMVAIGEETGQIDQMLLRVADAYDRETKAAAKVLTSILAPMLILVVAAIVGFIVMAMLLPIFKISTAM